MSNPALANELEVEGILRDLGYSQDELYDYTGLGDELYDTQLNDGLENWEIEDAKYLSRIFGGFRGIVLVTGKPGAGKGLFGNTLAWKIKRYIKGRKVLRDDRPRELFGAYIPFNEQFLINEIKKASGALNMIPKEISRQSKKELAKVSQETKDWMAKKGEILLTDTVMLLDEFKRYFHNRRPMNPMGVLLGTHVVTQWRHLNTLIIGMAPFKRELDAISLFPYVTHEVRCDWMLTRPNTAKCDVHFTKWVSSAGVLDVSRKPITLYLNGMAPREKLGDKNYFDIYNSTSKDTLANPRVRINM